MQRCVRSISTSVNVLYRSTCVYTARGPDHAVIQLDWEFLHGTPQIQLLPVAATAHLLAVDAADLVVIVGQVHDLHLLLFNF